MKKLEKIQILHKKLSFKKSKSKVWLQINLLLSSTTTFRSIKCQVRQLLDSDNSKLLSRSILPVNKSSKLIQWCKLKKCSHRAMFKLFLKFQAIKQTTLKLTKNWKRDFWMSTKNCALTKKVLKIKWEINVTKDHLLNSLLKALFKIRLLKMQKKLIHQESILPCKKTMQQLQLHSFKQASVWKVQIVNNWAWMFSSLVKILVLIWMFTNQHLSSTIASKMNKKSQKWKSFCVKTAKNLTSLLQIKFCHHQSNKLWQIKTQAKLDKKNNLQI